MNLFTDGTGVTRVADQTMVEPAVLVATLVLGATLLVLPRRYAVVPFVLLACFLPVSQRVAIAELDFNMIRILLAFGWARLFLRGDYRGVKLTALDYAFFAWVLVASVVFIIGRGDLDDAIFRAGQSYDLVGLFVLFRCWVRDFESLRVAVAAAAGSAIVVASVMSVEYSTGRNFFSVFGGVPEFTNVRDERLRCQATFSHPIMAGSVGAILAPLCLWLMVQRGRHRLLGASGWLASTAIVVFSSSSGPILAWFAGMGACGLWYVRGYVHLLRWAVVGGLLMLHLVANRPVWSWIGSMNVIGASTSAHRVRLINAAIDHFSEWALLGVESTGHWGYGLNDVTNQYILEGIRGGFAGMVALIVLLVVGFRTVGAALRRADRQSAPGGRRNTMLLFWAVGASLFVHSINFVGVAYFGQIQVFLVMTLAMIGGADATARIAATAPHRNGHEGANRVRALLRPTAAGT